MKIEITSAENGRFEARDPATGNPALVERICELTEPGGSGRQNPDQVRARFVDVGEVISGLNGKMGRADVPKAVQSVRVTPHQPG